MPSMTKTNSDDGFSLAKGFKKLKSKLIRKSKFEPDTETLRPLVETSDVKVENGSTMSRIILFLNLLAFIISLMGVGYVAGKYYRNISYFDIFDGYYGGVILLITVGVYFVTALISVAGMCWSVINILKIAQESLEVLLHAYIWWTAGLFVMQICVILMANSASENIDDIFKVFFDFIKIIF